MSKPDDLQHADDTFVDAWEDRLSEYLDDELERFEREELERHLAVCDSCRRTLDDLQALVVRATRLKRAVPPTHDLWPAVAARLQPGAARGFGTTPRKQTVRWLVPRLAAAAILVIACVVGFVWLRRPEPAARPVVEATRISIGHEHQPDMAFEDSVAELRRRAHARLREDPQVVNVLEDNLSALDRAIAEYRDALAEQPGDAELKRRLNDAMAHKLDLLQRVAGTSVEGTN